MQLLTSGIPSRFSFLKKWQVVFIIIGLVSLFIGTVLSRRVEENLFTEILPILAILLLSIAFVSLVIKGFRWIFGRFFYRVRHRIIATYFLTGILPLTLFAFLVLAFGYFFILQLTSFQVGQFIELEKEKLQQFTLEASLASINDDPEIRQLHLLSVLSRYKDSFPDATLMLYDPIDTKNILWSSSENTLPLYIPDGKPIALFEELDETELPDETPAEAAQMTEEIESSIHSIFLVYNDELYLSCAMSSTIGAKNPPVQIVVPIKDAYTDRIKTFVDGSVIIRWAENKSSPDVDESGNVTEQEGETKSLEETDSPASAESTIDSGSHLTIQNDGISLSSSPVGMRINTGTEMEESIEQWSRTLPEGFDYFMSYYLSEGVLLKSDDSVRSAMIIAILQTRYSFVIGKFLQGHLPKNVPIQTILYTLVLIIAGFFAIIELIALIISLVLSRSITKIIGQLHRKTQLISQGNFTYHIRSSRSDQLGELAKSFDRMSDELEILLEKMKEKERMEQELVIAQEVQRIFFPKELPYFEGIQLLGNCVPARSVSGDYYDFIRDQHNLDFFIGDISGKGISAALLMASSQTFLRLEAAKRPFQNVSEITTKFNNYLTKYSIDSKFSTLFYARFNKITNRLTYCNGGHLPPLLIRGEKVIVLTAGGIVPGLFPDREYEEDFVLIEPGDLFVAYTDGFTEVFDSNSEEFGEERLAHVLLESQDEDLDRLYETVLNTIEGWSASKEQADDMTILMIRFK